MRRARSDGRDGGRGFSVLEVVVMLAIMGILTNVAVHAALQASRRATAESIVEHFLRVRHAAWDHVRTTGRYPLESPRGVVPDELQDVLGHMPWSRPEADVVYDWESWIQRDGRARHPETGIAYGFSIVTNDHRLLDAIDRVYEGPFKRSRSDRGTFVIEYLDGTRPVAGLAASDR